MDSATLPYIPVSLWILAGAMTILILIVVFGFYVYWRKWAADLSETGLGVAALAARKLNLEKDVECLREWIQAQSTELDRIRVEREEQERLRAVLADLEQQCAIKNQENQTLRNEVGELENQRHHLAQILEKMQRDIGDLDAKRAEVHDLDSRLGELRSRLEEAQKTVRDVTELEVKLISLSNEKAAMERMIADLESESAAARAEADRLKGEVAQGRVEGDQIGRELALSRKEKAELSVIVDTLRQEQHALERSTERLEQRIEDLKATTRSAKEEAENQALQARQTAVEAERVSRELAVSQKEKAELTVIVDTLRREQHALEHSNERLEQRIEDLQTSARSAKEEAERQALQARQATVEAERVSRELAGLQKDRQRAEFEVGGLNARKAILEQEILRLQGQLGPGSGDGEDRLGAYADLLRKEPLCLSREVFRGRRDDQDESVFLHEVRRALRNEGLVFPSRIVDAFHTSLKCHDINPITVLAGVSGTGKTLLPVRYAEIMGMHRLVMAVQPRWDSPQDMFGFYNYLEKEYKATELSRALVRMDPYNYKEDHYRRILDSKWTWDRLLLVLIDEMNLARTEYYFSEFLSRLELRRAVKDQSLSAKRSEAEIELDAGPGEHRFRLWVPHNIFFVGTMNEDETTQTLSDKVLDRANVLRFGKPDENARAVRHGNGQYGASEKYLSFTQWHSWLREFKENDEWAEQVSNWTTRLNAALNRVGRPFGFRVQQAIGHYVANYPRVEDGERFKLAFADQVEQKIIPKIRGIDLSTDNANECLSELEAIIAELGDRDLSDAFSSARNESRIVGMFQWRGVTRREEEDATRHAH